MEGDANLFIKEDNTQYFITITPQRLHVTIQKNQAIQWFWEIVLTLSLVLLMVGLTVILTSPLGMNENIIVRSVGLKVSVQTTLTLGTLAFLLSILAKIWYHDEEIEVTPRGVETVHHFFKVKPLTITRRIAINELEVVTTPSTCVLIAKNDQQHLVTTVPMTHAEHVRSMIRRCWRTMTTPREATPQ